MALTVRLGPKTERALNALARRKRLSRSDIVREALLRYGAEEGMDVGGDVYAAWQDVIRTHFRTYRPGRRRSFSIVPV
jgi:predicted transcriptional regulator